METTESKIKELGLKHLGFVRLAAIQFLFCLSFLYNYAKLNSGPFKSAVYKVEEAVTTIFNPVYQKYEHVPYIFLVFLDYKVGVAVHKFDKHAPPMAKQVVSQSSVLINMATKKTLSFVKVARTGGPKAAIKFAATEYMYFLITISVIVWIKLNHYKPIRAVGDKVLPVAANLSGLYNDLVTDMTEMGYPVVGYFPLVPVDDILKAYKKENAKTKKAFTTGKDSSSDSD